MWLSLTTAENTGRVGNFTESEFIEKEVACQRSFRYQPMNWYSTMTVAYGSTLCATESEAACRDSENILPFLKSHIPLTFDAACIRMASS